MIRYQSQYQIPIEEFRTPFEIKLSKENRWAKLAAVLPWDALAKIYYRRMSKKKGRPSVNARIIIGALIIKHKEVLADVPTIVAIQENVYQQYFLGLTQYQYEPVFDASLFVTIRKRIGVEAFDAMVLEMMRVVEAIPKTISPAIVNEHVSSTNDPEAHQPSAENISPRELDNTQVSDEKNTDVQKQTTTTEPSPSNQGTLIVDMTVAPADIAYPTDIELLNTAREKTEQLIDVLHGYSSQKIKPRTYRKKARKDYLAIAKQRKRSMKSIRKAIRKQLGYVGRNIKTIDAMLDASADFTSFAERRTFWIIQELYRQQKEMFDAKTHRVADRIVSVAQPHVRPIVRNKAKARTEFGAQVSASIMNGVRRIHRIEWDAYNEASDLKKQIESYKTTFDVYPEVVLADKKYATKENRDYMKERGIIYGGTPLGRPKKDGTSAAILPKKIINQRNHIEGTFGTGKRSYGLDCILARRPDTSASWIAAIFFVMNLPLVLKHAGSFLLSFFEYVFNLVQRALRYLFGRDKYSFFAVS